jgi:ABC-type multidrug transport system fused ATPase/permease subunit
LTELKVRAGLRELFGIMSARRKKQLGLVFVLMLIGAAAELMTIGAVLPFLQLMVNPQAVFALPAVQALREPFGWNEPADLLLPATLLLIATAIFSAVARLALTWVSQKFVYRLGYDFDMQIYERTIRQPYGAYIRRNSSEILSGLEKVNNVTTWMLMPLMQAFISAVIALFIIVFLFMIDPLTAAAATVSMGLLYLTISLLTRRALRWLGERWSLILTGRTKAVQESLGGLRDIILDQSQGLFIGRFSKIDDEFRNLSVKVNFISAAPRFLVEGGGVILIGLLTLYYSTQQGGVIAAVPVLGALALGAQRLLPLVQNVYVGWTQYASVETSLADALELMKGPILTAHTRPKDMPVEPFGDRIELRDLTFRYVPEAAALDCINLTIRKGERVGFIGKTGSGKSTLVDVLMGLLEPSSGAVLPGGDPLGDHNMLNWQAQIAHVPQAIFLSDDSIAANIAFGQAANEIDMARVRDAARRADIDEFIDKLPDGYLTPVGERGIRLSGGQRQRVGIARALYKKATVLILDEATSALDDATEASIMEAIDRLDRDLTVLLIAHRLSTVARCDTVYRLDGGRIVAQGSYAEVIGKAKSTPDASDPGPREFR